MELDRLVMMDYAVEVRLKKTMLPQPSERSAIQAALQSIKLQIHKRMRLKLGLSHVSRVPRVWQYQEVYYFQHYYLLIEKMTYNGNTL